MNIAPSFHLDARDVVTGQVGSGVASAVFYLSQVCLLCDMSLSAPPPFSLSPRDMDALQQGRLCDESRIREHVNERNRQLRAGVLLRIGDAAGYIEHMSREEGVCAGVCAFSVANHRREWRQFRRRYFDGVASASKDVVDSSGKAEPATRNIANPVVDGGVDDMSKLRILSRAALDFL